MTQKPTYEELKQRVEELEQQAVARQQAEEAMRESEEKYCTLVKNSLIGIFIHQDGRYVFVNDRFADIHGYQPEELLGLDPLTLIHPDYRDSFREVLSKILKGESAPNRYEIRRLRKDGNTVWCEMMATSVEYAGKPAVMGNIIDITERKRAEDALRHSEANYRLLFSAGSDAIIVVDAKTMKIVDANEAALALYGYGREDLLELRATELSTEPEKSAQNIEQVALGKPFLVSPSPVQRLHKKKDGTIFPVEISSGVYALRRRKMVCAVIRDITERKRVEEALQESARRMQIAYDQAINYAEALNKEIDERKRAEEALQTRKEQLKAQATNLEEVNTALKVLLRQREEDKIELEEKVLSNLKQLVMPYIQTLRNSRLGAKELAYVDIIDSNITEIVSPFLRSLSSKYLGLTPKEMQIADLIRLGNTTKEIGDLLNVSTRAIEFHRENIRAKLGLKNKKVNLRSFLLSFE